MSFLCSSIASFAGTRRGNPEDLSILALTLDTMGIRGLWKMLEASSKDTSLIDLSVNEGPGTVRFGLDDVRGYRVGIDVSVWFYQANAHNRQTKNAALASLFKRLAALFSLTTVIAICVFDGAGRPKVKRKTNVRSTSSFLNSDFKSLIQSFGWKYVDAPGEAEAELAWMCAHNIIDAVLTEDSDTFVFGAPRVIRIREISESVIDVTVYENIGLSREQLVFIALLAGGDYSDGIPGCGVKTARRLALAGFGDDLIQAALELSSAKFYEFRPLWRERFQTTVSCLSYTRSLSKKIPDDFPDYDTLRLYLCPLSSQGAMPPPMVRWDSSPRLGDLAAFAARNLVWGLDSTQLFQHFKRSIFPGLAVRELLKSIPSDDGEFNVDICPYSVIIGRHRNQGTTHDRRTYLSLQITPPLLDEMQASASAAGMQGSLGSVTRYMRAWVQTGLYNLAQSNPEDVDDTDNVEMMVEEAIAVAEETTTSATLEAMVAPEADDNTVDVTDDESTVEQAKGKGKATTSTEEGSASPMEVIDIDDGDVVLMRVGIPPGAEIISLLSDEEEMEEAEAAHATIEVIDISDNDD